MINESKGARMTLSNAPKQCLAMLQALPQAMLENAPGKAHTDIHTYKHPITFWSYLTLGDAHTRVARSPQRSGRNERTASAARGLAVPHA